MTSPPETPLSGWSIVALLVAGTVYLLLRATGNHHGWGARLGVVAGSFFALPVPSVAVMATQDLTCRDGGVLERPSGALVVVGMTGLALAWLLAMFWVAGDREPGSGRRLAVIPPALLVPVALVELMGPLVPLEHYCDGVGGVLHVQAALALLVPVAAIGLALIKRGPSEASSRVSRPLVLGSAIVVLVAQVAVLSDRLPPAPLACVARQSVAAVPGPGGGRLRRRWVGGSRWGGPCRRGPGPAQRRAGHLHAGGWHIPARNVLSGKRGGRRSRRQWSP